MLFWTDSGAGVIEQVPFTGGKATTVLSQLNNPTAIAISVSGSYWTGANSTNWADSGNWSGNVPGATAGTTNIDTATFDRNASKSPLTIDAGRNVQNLTFDTASVNSLTIGTIGGQALMLTAGGTIQTTSTVVNSQTVNAPLVLEGDYTFTSGASSSSATLSFRGGIIPGATSGVTTLTLNGANTGANTISGVLADNGAGKLAVTKERHRRLGSFGREHLFRQHHMFLPAHSNSISPLATPTIAAGRYCHGRLGRHARTGRLRFSLGHGGRQSRAHREQQHGLGRRRLRHEPSRRRASTARATRKSTPAAISRPITSFKAPWSLAALRAVPALVTIDASDASGNPLGQPSGFALAGSLTPSGPFGADGISSATNSPGGADPAVLSPGNSAVGGNPSSVPEPSS